MGHKWHGKNVKPRNKKLVAQNVELKKEPTNEGPHSQLSNTNKSWLCFKIKMVMINHSQTRQVYSHPFAIIYNMVHIQHYIVLWIVEQHIPYHISHILTIKLRHVTIYLICLMENKLQLKVLDLLNCHKIYPLMEFFMYLSFM